MTKPFPGYESTDEDNFDHRDFVEDSPPPPSRTKTPVTNTQPMRVYEMIGGPENISVLSEGDDGRLLWVDVNGESRLAIETGGRMLYIPLGEITEKLATSVKRLRIPKNKKAVQESPADKEAKRKRKERQCRRNIAAHIRKKMNACRTIEKLITVLRESESKREDGDITLRQFAHCYDTYYEKHSALSNKPAGPPITTPADPSAESDD